MKNLLKDFILRTQTFLVHSRDNKSLFIQQESAYRDILNDIRTTMPENPVLQSRKVYSQNQEDGIIIEIFRRIGKANTFFEIGLQDGTECNSLNLLLNGWKGTWIEGDQGYHQQICTTLGGDTFKDKLQVVKAYVDASNICSLYEKSKSFLKVPDIDFFSLDIDGNDYYVAESLLKGGHRPNVFCVEYNAKFPPPMDITIQYDPQHRWDRTDYQGASLQSFVNLFKSFDYTLVSCDVAGINAFFVRNDFLLKFTKYEVLELYQPPRYHLSPFYSGHAPSLRFLKNILNAGK